MKQYHRSVNSGFRLKTEETDANKNSTGINRYFICTTLLSGLIIQFRNIMKDYPESDPNNNLTVIIRI